MRELREIADTTLRGLFGPINLPVAVELTIKVRRPRRVDGPSVEVPYFSMTMIRFGMDMEQGSREHPHGGPHDDRQTSPRECSTLWLHFNPTLAPFSDRSNHHELPLPRHRESEIMNEHADEALRVRHAQACTRTYSI